MLSSYHQHGQAKTCPRSEHRWRQSQTVFSSPQYIGQWTVLSSPVCGLNTCVNKSRRNAVYIAFRDKTAKNLNMSTVEIFCRRQSWLVTWSVHSVCGLSELFICWVFVCISLSVCLTVCLPVCVCVCQGEGVSVWETRCKYTTICLSTRLFAKDRTQHRQRLTNKIQLST